MAEDSACFRLRLTPPTSSENTLAGPTPAEGGGPLRSTELPDPGSFLDLQFPPRQPFPIGGGLALPWGRRAMSGDILPVGGATGIQWVGV